MATTVILLVIFATSIAVATFIENDFGTSAAKLAVYNAKWFEVLLFITSINLVGSLFKYKLVSQKKWTVILFHVAFLIIIAGAGITRYFGYEGSMHIREGQSANTIKSYTSFLDYRVDVNDQSHNFSEKLVLSSYKNSEFQTSHDFNSKELSIKLMDYVESAAKMMREVENGSPNLNIIVSDSLMQYQNNYISHGGNLSFGNVDYSFTDNSKADVSFIVKDDSLYVRFNKRDAFTVNMNNNSHDTLIQNNIYKVNFGSLYQIGSSGFIIRKFSPSSKVRVVSMKGHQGTYPMNALGLRVSYGDDQRDLYLFGSQDYTGNTEKLNFDGLTVYLSYGPREYKLPFELYLKDFILERYVGSESPSSFKSNIILKDKEENIEKPYSIFMNNVLTYNGYRFFQSSYDKDEKGTVLSVNYDPIGTRVTYFGYFLMTLGMFLAIFSRKSYFKELLRKSSKASVIILISLFAFVLNSNAQNDTSVTIKKRSPNFTPPAPEMPINMISENHAEEFGKLLVVDLKGRIKPVNTLASEITRKITKKRSFEDYKPVEMFLAMTANPIKWQNAPIIKVSNDELKSILEVESDHISFNQIMQLERFGGYKIKKYIDEAYAKKVNERDKFDKEVIKVDERINICFLVFSGSILTVFPNPDGEKWLTAMESKNIENQKYRDRIKFLHFNYLNSVREGINQNEWQNANSYLDSLKVYQQKYSGDELPSQSRIQAEVFYNKASFFSIASKLYLALGLLLLVVLLIKLFNSKNTFGFIISALNGGIILVFLAHTFFLGLRWYISGHAPWSNGYETTLFIAWVTVFAGILFVRRSEISLALTTVIGAVLLLISSLSFMDPEITNLAPVLRSYWLVIHVAVITSSYGFFGLSAIMGLTNLGLNIFKFKSNAHIIDNTTNELSNIIRMAIIIGLYLLTIGTFLGAVWANESWGRYWGWDPKETWALVSILVYTIISHMRNIPGLKGNLAVSFGSLIGFASIMMTYFGVNYFLSGMHSYAGGDEISIPTYVYIIIISVLSISIISLIKNGLRKTILD